MDSDSTLTRVGQQHFHLRFGPEQVDEYGILEQPFAGPYMDVIYDDVLTAGVQWIDCLLHYMPDFLDDEEIDILMQDFADYADVEADPEREIGISMEVEYGIPLGIEECYGCVPKHTN